MIKQPLVSIVIPAFTPRFFSMALESALMQTYERLEVVVCDDSQTDEIETIVRASERNARVPIRYVRNATRLGFVDNLIQAVELASGDLLKVLCDDDRLLGLCIERQARVLEENPDVSLVLSQRMFTDADNYVLPMRLANARFANVDSLFKGDDILSMLDGRAVNFLGNLSAALMRREQALQQLKALTQGHEGFVALLDQALFVCLLRRGHLVMLSDVASIERLHPQRLSRQDSVADAAQREWKWLQQMLAARGGDAPPANGWIQYIPLSEAQALPRPWQEMSLVLLLSNWQTCVVGRIGSDCESYAEVYQQWLQDRHLSPAQRHLLPNTLSSWPSQPRIVPVILDLAGDAEALRQTVESLESQLYPAHCCIVLSGEPVVSTLPLVQVAPETDWAAQLNPLIGSVADADWIYLLRAGDRLGESALLILAERAAVLPGLACMYSDEGALVDGQSAEPVFKPDFNVDLMRSYPYVGRTLAFARDALCELGGFDPAFGELAPHDLIWRLVEWRGPQVIEHIPEIQVQSLLGFAQWLSTDAVIQQSERVVQAHLGRLEVAHRVSHDDLPLLNRIEYLHGAEPLVSIIVLCGDDLEALQGCVLSVMERTAYQHYELLLVAPVQSDASMAGWLDAMAEVGGAKLRVVQASEARDVAGMINGAAHQARGDYLLMLSANLQVFEPRWLDEMVMHAQRPEVAVVGARVLDERGKIVNAGMVLGVDNAVGPVCVGEDALARGYLQRLQVVQNWSAVSGDCLMVRQSVFEDLGGIDAQHLGWELGALDLCLKAGTDGYLVVWTPHASLCKAANQTPAAAPDEQETLHQAFYERWLPLVVRDPAYNPNLSLMSANFSLEPGQHGAWNPLCARVLPSVLALPINASAVGHYRVSQPFFELEAAGRIVGRVAHESPTTVQLARMNPDVVVLQLRHTEDSVRDIERIARFSNARRIFEIDDYVLQAPSKNTHARNKPADIEQHLRKGIGLCDRLVVTTQALANALSDMHTDIRVVPNMLAPHLWTGLHSRRGTSSKPRVGWGGGTSHSGDLEVIADVVRELADEVEWVFFGMCPEALKPYIHEFHPVIGLQAYPAKLASLNLDLALAPLEFHIFNDCKSNLRLLEYGACGYPVVCTDTEAYRGDLPCTRILGNSTEEWLQAIRMHLSDPAASYRMGDQLRDAVLRDFVLRDGNLDQWVRGWLAD
ncbi:MAG TPA: glycosyltransferase [Pseudomonas sp.]|uniref:glycosyltransferase n=1 Tax=Pseudomonas sp. TaxID=306 RepID=UPI002B4706B0|nr:glycosyltransferase [Pseudomonas sp.]HKS11868.1 glycosyltransferase [Pseudomonas sp.]